MMRWLRLSAMAAIGVALGSWSSDGSASWLDDISVHYDGCSMDGCSARTIDPIVSTAWLSDSLLLPDLVVLDVRPAEAYAEGHIPGSINAPFVVPFSAWITMRDDLLLEVPDEADLFDAIGSMGITRDSSVVVVSAPNPGEPPAYGHSAATRVADTLIYSGLKDVAILDGGFTKWSAEGRETSTEEPAVTPVIFDGELRESMFVSKEYVEERIGWSVIIDARDADVYFGATIEPFAPEPGHIPSARSLPAPWIWNADETYRDEAVLEAMAHGVVGWSKRREVIVYCGVGGYASSWWYLLTQVLGYRNVKFYDGAAQEWVRTNGMVPYHWY